MERVTGIGGVFIKAKNPAALGRWYREHLGVDVKGAAPEPPVFKWREHEDPQRPGHTVWALFDAGTTYFDPSRAPFMINYRVRNLDRMLQQLRERGAQVDDKIVEEANGRFGWVMDPEGNRLELWEPADGW